MSDTQDVTFGGRLASVTGDEGASSQWVLDADTMRGVLCQLSQSSAVVHPPAAHTVERQAVPIYNAGRLTIHGVTITERTS